MTWRHIIRRNGKRYVVTNAPHRLPLYQRLHIAATLADASAWRSINGKA